MPSYRAKLAGSHNYAQIAADGSAMWVGADWADTFPTPEAAIEGGLRAARSAFEKAIASDKADREGPRAWLGGAQPCSPRFPHWIDSVSVRPGEDGDPAFDQAKARAALAAEAVLLDCDLSEPAELFFARTRLGWIRFEDASSRLQFSRSIADASTFASEAALRERCDRHSPQASLQGYRVARLACRVEDMRPVGEPEADPAADAIASAAEARAIAACSRVPTGARARRAEL